MEQEQKQAVRLYLTLTCLWSGGISFIGGIYANYLLSKGLDLFQINLVNMAFFATLLVADIPTGAFADQVSREKSVIIGCVFFSVSAALYGLAHNFADCVLAEIIAAIGASFFNGALKGWLSSICGKEFAYKKVYAQESQITCVAGMATGFAGLMLSHISPMLPWFSISVVMISCGIVAYWKMKESKISSTAKNLTEHSRRIWQKIHQGITYTARHKTIKLVVLMGIVQFFSVQAINMQWQPFFRQMLSPQNFSLIYVGIKLSELIGAAISHRIKAEHEIASLIVIQMIIGIGILLTPICPAIGAITFFAIHEIARGSFRPIKDAVIERGATDENRATVFSCDSTARTVFNLLGLFASGYWALNYSIKVSWLLSGGILIIGTIIIAAYYRRQK